MYVYPRRTVDVVDVITSTTAAPLCPVAMAHHVARVTVVIFRIDGAVQAVVVPAEASRTRLHQHRPLPD